VNHRSPKTYNKILRPDKIRFNKRVYMFLFFLFISIILWLLIKLRYEYVSTVTYDINLSELPENKVVVAPNSLSVTVKIKALGYNLLRYKLFRYYKPLSVNANAIQYNDGKYYLLLSTQLNRFSAQLGSNLTLLEVSPDTLYFQLSDVVKRTIPVKPDLTITYAKQYMQAGSYSVRPSEVEVVGPASIVDTINFAHTLPMVLENISDSVDAVLQLKPISGLRFRPSGVHVIIPVEKFTEAKINVPVSCVNVPAGYNVLFAPKEVTVTCNVAVSKYFTLKPNHFAVTCDYTELIAEKSSKAVVKLTMYPNFIGRIQIEPRKVDFVIVKKK